MPQNLIAGHTQIVVGTAPQRPALKIRKISPELRRRMPVAPPGLTWYRRTLWNMKNDSQFLRSTVQLAFVLLCVWIGIEFHLFMRWGLSGGTTSFVARPPGAEGFLPIGALMSFKYWFDSGIVNQIHPSGLYIFVAIVVISLMLKKAFCSWLCPIGTLSESLWMLGEKVFGRNVIITKWLDIPLRSLKYFLLLFFVAAIWGMDVPSMKAFIESPYNRMADVKMYLFFARITSTALWTVLILMMLSVVVKNFWCRYLCPYGAFLGFLSLLSPVKITRQKSTCVDCELCTKACPSDIIVHLAGRVRSDECTACLKCVEVCPVKNTLSLRTPKSSTDIPAWVFGGLVAGVFAAITGLAIMTGSWQNNISKEEYRVQFQQLESSAYSHPFGGSGSDVPNGE
ncbi:MAG: 4Fe-4S binding protein [Ignavibacteriales bacterium]|nr:4Fe-4S binding protein [Ignavibacteriales bacterium]